MDYVYVHDFFSCFCPCNWGTRKRVDTAPKASGCFLGRTQEIFGAVSEDLLGGTGKAEDAKLPGAGIIRSCAQWRGRSGADASKRVHSVHRRKTRAILSANRPPTTGQFMWMLG